MKFVEEKPKVALIPDFEDADSSEGWEGHRTRKSLEQLKTEVGEAIALLGGFVSLIQSGTYEINGKQRGGYRIIYSLEGVPSRMDIAALPTRHNHHREDSLKMALYIVRNSLKGMALFQKLSPGFAALIPLMLDAGGKTLSERWLETPKLAALMPSSDSKFREGDEDEIIEGDVNE
jgi:hypothetical protein